MKILLLCLYPIANPAHGGQLRVRHIVESYRAAGHSVRVSGVLGSDQYPSEEGFLPFPGAAALATVMARPALLEDYAIGLWCLRNEKYAARLGALCVGPYDVIHIEQPWLFEFAWRCGASQAPRPKLVYGSQNIEAPLKQVIVASTYGIGPGREAAALIEQCEQAAIDRADAIVCVSEHDRAWLQARTSQPVVLAPNGVRPWQSSPAGRQQAEAIAGGLPYALYCASAHPPNMNGFFELFGGGFGSLKPDQRLVVAGGAGVCIAQDPRLQQSALLAQRTLACGVVSQACLEGLLDGAHCIVLPLTQGGGTNLKTAEALWSGKHIVATSVALRGFEGFIGSSGVWLADEPAAFKRTLRHVMSLPPLALTKPEVQARRSVLWEHCLSPLSPMLAALAQHEQT